MTSSSSEKPPVSRRQFLKMAAVGGTGALAMSSLGPFGSLVADACGKSSKLPTITAPVLSLATKDFSHLPGKLSDISATQLSQHIKLYEGYVKKYNAVQHEFDVAQKTKDFGKARGLQLRQSYALNGAILHDLYFSNLSPEKSTPDRYTRKLIDRDFGSLKVYLDDLTATGTSMRGWAMTGLSLLDGQLHNYGLDAHDQGTPMGVVPLVVLDVYEHAYMIDYGTNRGAYIGAFVDSIDWPVVEKRLVSALDDLNRVQTLT